MAYRVFWQIPQQILCVELKGSMSLDDFDQIDQAILDHLGDERIDQRITLLVDISLVGTMPQIFEQLRKSQTYLQRRDLESILVAGSNKFARLIMMLTFNLSKPHLGFFDNVDQALAFAQRTINTF